MGTSDRTAAGWVLMALSIGAGVWYWHLLPGERRNLLSGGGLDGGASGGGGATGLYDPSAYPPGGGPPTDEQLRRQGATPFDAGARLAGLRS